jgi:DNA topoisomerase III
VQLVVAEKPSVARDLARVLGVRGGGEWLENDRYAITWCIGHLVELEEPVAYDAAWKAWRLDALPMLPAEFLLRPAHHAAKQLRVVAKFLRDRRFTSVINACDAGREGELIFRYVYQYARSRLPVQRLWISSLTDDAIRRGFATLRPGRDYDPLADAARSRSEADWLVGMNATRAVTVRSRGAGGDTLFSIGRVQTPTLALLVAREREIRAFVPRPYWEVRGELTTADGAKFPALWRDGKLCRLAAAPLADEIVARDREHAGIEDPAGPHVVKLRARTVREPPPQLFDLTSLQRTANRRFGFSAARTLEIAQALYERHKLVTYPRTDSRHLSTDSARELAPVFAALAGYPHYAPFANALIAQPPRLTARIVDDSKVHDHHAIIPTAAAPRGSLDRDESRLFDLIVRRFLGAFFPDAEIAITEAWIRVGAGDAEAPELGPPNREQFVEVLPAPPDHYFARGRVRLVAGWQEVAGIEAERKDKRRDDDDAERRKDKRPDGDDDDAIGALPPLVVGQHLAGMFTSVARETTPPPRCTEATLLAAMESAGKSIDDEALRAAMKDVGLGTPATRAAIIETLLRRKYIVREQKHLVPTDTGIGLIAALHAAKVASLASAELTGSWEARLARVARGEETRDRFMADIARYITEIIDAIRGGSAPIAPVPRGGSAPITPVPRGGSAPIAPVPRGGSAPLTPVPRGGSAPIAPVPRGGSAPPASIRATSPAQSAIARSHVSPKTKVRSQAKTKRATQTPARALPPLTCPRCKQGTLITGARGWGCDRWRDGCRFVIWFQTAGRRLTTPQLRALITKGKTGKANFVDATGKPIAARLVLDPSSASGIVIQPTKR